MFHERRICCTQNAVLMSDMLHSECSSQHQSVCYCILVNFLVICTPLALPWQRTWVGVGYNSVLMGMVLLDQCVPTRVLQNIIMGLPEIMQQIHTELKIPWKFQISLKILQEFLSSNLQYCLFVLWPANVFIGKGFPALKNYFLVSSLTEKLQTRN